MKLQELSVINFSQGLDEVIRSIRQLIKSVQKERNDQMVSEIDEPLDLF
jgi:hypothetical protein